MIDLKTFSIGNMTEFSINLRKLGRLSTCMEDTCPNRLGR